MLAFLLWIKLTYPVIRRANRECWRGEERKHTARNLFPSGLPCERQKKEYYLQTDMTKKEQEPRSKATHEGRRIITSQKRYLGQKIFVTLSNQLLSHKKNYYRIKRTEWGMWSSLWKPLSPRRQRKKFSWKEEEKGKKGSLLILLPSPKQEKVR